MREIIKAAAVGTIAAAMFAAPTLAQKAAPGDIAAKMTGTWVLNRELSTGFRTAPGRRGGGQAPSSSARFAVASAVPQRGGGGGASPSDASDLTPEQRAEQAAMLQVQQIAEQITINATPESITFSDARGERTYAVNDKSTKLQVAGATVNVKSKWDKATLKQEFSNTQAKLTQTWAIDDSGHLVLGMKLESMTLRTPEQKAVFDKK
jgi:hypothetical protein